MKFSVVVGLALAAESVNAAALQPRHYTFPSLIGESKQWDTVRQTLNYQSNAGVTDVSSEAIRCYTRTGEKGSSVKTVAAGSSIGFTSSPTIFHPGPIQFYIAKVPSGQDVTTWDGSGQVWAKIYSEPAINQGGQLSWASLNKNSASVNIPANTPAGDYLLRIEHIALHGASQTNGAQFYISCAQIRVTGGGSGTPGPLVAFPGAYSASDPGIKVNIYGGGGQYKAPGPAVWTG